MEKKNIFFILATLIVAALAYFLIDGNSAKNIDLSLAELKSDGEYRFYGIDWDLPADAVDGAMADGIQIDPNLKPPEYTGYVYYVSKNPYTLDGVTDIASVQFYKGGLEIVQFSFPMGENNQQWFEKQVAELTGLYGEHTRKTENELEHLNSTVYTWETDNSILRIALLTGEKRRPSVILSVGKKITEERSYDPPS